MLPELTQEDILMWFWKKKKKLRMMAYLGVSLEKSITEATVLKETPDLYYVTYERFSPVFMTWIPHEEWINKNDSNIIDVDGQDRPSGTNVVRADFNQKRA
jgi:hypothetical protein